MKCANCGMEISPTASVCGRCGKHVSREFNFKNMEKELLHTVWEEETINGISGGAMLYQQTEQNQKGMSKIREYNRYEEAEELDDETDTPPEKQPVKLVIALMASTAAFAGLTFFLHNFSTDYVYGKTDAEYQNCLARMANEEYTGALDSADLLLEGEPDNLAWLALKNTICEKSGDSKTQKQTLKKIIELDTDNYQAYEKLLELYLADENQKGIEKLAANAPNSAIASMLSEYLVDTPYLELTPGVYDASQSLSITSDKNSIYYTLDGSSPQEKGILYAAPVPLEQGYIYSVRAICKNERGAYGDEASGEYQIGINAVNYVSSTENISDGQISQPEIYPQSGTYTTQQRITIDVPIGYQAYYSWLSQTALTPQNGTLYTGGITMPEGSSVLSVIIADENGNCSEVKQVSYTYQP